MRLAQSSCCLFTPTLVPPSYPIKSAAFNRHNSLLPIATSTVHTRQSTKSHPPTHRFPLVSHSLFCIPPAQPESHQRPISGLALSFLWAGRLRFNQREAEWCFGGGANTTGAGGRYRMWLCRSGIEVSTAGSSLVKKSSEQYLTEAHKAASKPKRTYQSARGKLGKSSQNLRELEKSSWGVGENMGWFSKNP